MLTKENPRQQPFSARAVGLFWPIALFTIAAGILLIAGVLFAVRQVDQASATRAQIMAQSGIEQRIEEVALMIVPQVVWDEAVDRLDRRFDPEWADSNLGSFLTNVSGFERAFVLAPDDRLLWSSRGGVAGAYANYLPFAEAVAPLVARVRQAEARRPPLRRKGDHQLVADPIQFNGIEMVDAAPRLLTASLVQPDFGMVMPRGARAPIVITSMPIDKPFLAKFARRYMMNDLRVFEVEAERPQDRIEVPLRNVDGGIVARLVWSPRRPGTELLRTLVLPLLVVLSVTILVALWLLLRSRRIALALIESEALARQLANYDGLTNLPNRRLMNERLQYLISSSERSTRQIAVHCIDLDRFKMVNDTMGHHAGDEVLRVIGERIETIIRVGDTASRIGGDEFVIIQPDATATRASRLAERLVEICSLPISLGEVQAYIGCSVGIALFQPEGMTPEEALRQGDIAMYKAKEAGRGRYAFFEVELDSAVQMRRELERDLRDALRNDQFEMVYQPQVDATGRIIGCEALMRWTHPRHGAVSPTVFIPIAEECGLIADLGLFSCRRVFEDARNWGELKVALNISATHLQTPDFVRRVDHLLAQSGLSGDRIEIEITETALLRQEEANSRTLWDLRKLGISITLDDFGTGYSSMTYLQKFPIDKIKIDRSFVSHLGEGERARAVVDAVVRLASALDIDIVAEGVETDVQHKALVELGCPRMQGFLYSVPLPAAEMTTLLAAKTSLKA